MSYMKAEFNLLECALCMVDTCVFFLARVGLVKRCKIPCENIDALSRNLSAAKDQDLNPQGEGNGKSIRRFFQ